MSSSHILRRSFYRLLGERRTSHRGGRRRSDREPRRGWIPAAWIAAVIALSDWTTKALVTATVPLEGFQLFLGDRVALWHVRNPAMMLGLWGDLPLEGRKAIAICAAMVTSVFLLQIVGRGHRLERSQRPWAWLFVGLVLGGMLGNLGERALHWWVTDFLSIRWGDMWLPPGNVADIALFLSIPLALPVALFETFGRMRRGTGTQPVPAAAAAVAGDAGTSGVGSPA